MAKTVIYLGLNKQLEVHERVAPGGIPMEAPVLSVRWDPKESLEASARLRSNISLHAKRAWKGSDQRPHALPSRVWPCVRQSVARG